MFSQAKWLWTAERGGVIFLFASLQFSTFRLTFVHVKVLISAALGQ